MPDDLLSDDLLVALKMLTPTEEPDDGHSPWVFPTVWLARQHAELARLGLIEIDRKAQARVTDAGREAAKQGYAGERAKEAGR